jgi:hypothetical protein
MKANSKRLAGIWVGLGTAPLLVGLLGARAIAAAMQEMGAASEEIFRGDRLPILKITPPDPNPVDSQS